MPPLSKRRQIHSTKTKRPDELTFDPAARAEYLTGFHKRKQARVKLAQEVASKKKREAHLQERREMRQQRQKDLEAHVKAVNSALRRGESEELSGGKDLSATEDDDDERVGIKEEALKLARQLDPEDDYIDEELYAKVTVGEVEITRSGFTEAAGVSESESNPEHDGNNKDNDHSGINGRHGGWNSNEDSAREAGPKKKRKKFCYESKLARKAARAREHSQNARRAQVRKQKLNNI